MQVLIIEDEPLAAEKLEMQLRSYDENIQVLAKLTSVEESVQWLTTKPMPDLMFVDIELSDGKCFDIFEQVNLNIPVVITTAYDQYALDAFKHFSIDYLLKPVTMQALASTLNKIKTLGSLQMQNSQVPPPTSGDNSNYKQRFMVRIGNRMFFVPTQEIAGFVADEKSVFLLNKEGQRFPMNTTLEHLQDQLQPSTFFRVNRKAIISIDAIKDIKRYLNSRLKISLNTGNVKDDIIVAREKVAAFKAWAEA
jgi:two-component system, LytTR family, response regulator LytT